MTNLKRYNLAANTLAGVVEHAEGSFVHWNDYARLMHDIEAGAAEIAKYKAWAASCEPLPCPKCRIPHYPNCEPQMRPAALLSENARLRNDIQELTCGDPRLVSSAVEPTSKPFKTCVWCSTPEDCLRTGDCAQGFLEPVPPP